MSFEKILSTQAFIVSDRRELITRTTFWRLPGPRQRCGNQYIGLGEGERQKFRRRTRARP